MITLIMGHATHCPVRCKAEDVPNENIVWQFCRARTGQVLVGKLTNTHLGNLLSRDIVKARIRKVIRKKNVIVKLVEVYKTEHEY